MVSFFNLVDTCVSCFFSQRDTDKSEEKNGHFSFPLENNNFFF